VNVKLGVGVEDCLATRAVNRQCVLAIDMFSATYCEHIEAINILGSRLVGILDTMHRHPSGTSTGSVLSVVLRVSPIIRTSKSARLTLVRLVGTKLGTLRLLAIARPILTISFSTISTVGSVPLSLGAVSWHFSGARPRGTRGAFCRGPCARCSGSHRKREVHQILEFGH
jgi:hypothetical protein